MDHVLKISDFSRQIVDVKAIFLLSYGTLTNFSKKLIGGFFEL